MNHEQHLSAGGYPLMAGRNQSKITNYAKQTQFAGCSNERKFFYNKGL